MAYRKSKANNNESKTTNFNYLSEEPKIGNADDPLSFGHEQVADTLRKIIVEGLDKRSFTIGLLGGFGTGKSTIIGTLKEKLKTNKNIIPLVTFDVWKHEGDALRRSFLQEMDRQLKKEGTLENFNLHERLKARIKEFNEQIKTLSFGKIFKQNIKVYAFSALLSIPPLFFLFLLDILPYLIDHTLPLLAVIIINLSGGFLSILSIFVTKQFISQYIRANSIVQPKQYETEYERLEDPKEFEEEFKRILGQIKAKKLVIVFDNLDRVSEDKVLNILSTIKTFLEPIDQDIKNKNINFIISCDYEAIKTALAKENGRKDSDGFTKEYIRKIFNTTVTIPDFHVSDFNSFAYSKLDETEIPEFKNKELSFLLTQIFRNNPRQIIQFINVLITKYLLLNRLKEDGFVPNKFPPEQNLPQLAKFLLLYDFFPKTMKKIKEQQLFNIHSPDSPNSPFKEIIERGSRLENEFSKFKNFLEKTDHIKITSGQLEFLFDFKTSDKKRDFTEAEFLIQAMQYNEVKNLFDEEETSSEKATNKERIFQIFQDPKNLESFESIILDEELDKFTAAQDNIKNIFLNNIFYLTDYSEQHFSSNFYEKLSFHLAQISSSQAHLLEPDILENEFFQKYQTKQESHKRKVKSNIINRWIEVIGNEKQYKEGEVDNSNIPNEKIRRFAFQVLNNFNYVTKNLKNNFANVIKKYYLDDFEVLSMIINHKELQDKIIDEEFIENLLNSLSVEDFEDYLGLQREQQNNKVAILKKINDEKFKHCGNAIFKWANDFFVKHLPNKFEELLQSTYQEMAAFCTILLDRIEFNAENQGEAYKNTLGSLQQVFDHLEPDKLWSLIPILLKLEEFREKNNSSFQFGELAMQFFNNAKLDRISRIFEFSKKHNLNSHFDRMTIYLVKRILNEPDSFERLFNFTSQTDSKKYFIEALINQIISEIKPDQKSPTPAKQYLSIFESFLKVEEFNTNETFKSALTKLIEELLNPQRLNEVNLSGVKLIKEFYDIEEIKSNFTRSVTKLYSVSTDETLNNVLFEILNGERFIDSFTFKNQEYYPDRKDLDDHYYPEVLNPSKLKYTIKLKPTEDSERWRVGFKLSNDKNLPEFIGDKEKAQDPRKGNGVALFHLTKNQEDNKLKYVNFSENGKGLNENSEVLIEEYENDEVIIHFKVKGEETVINVQNQKGENLKAFHYPKIYQYSRLFAWADNKAKFKIEAEIHKELNDDS